eukprot:TRINITY_DN34762_c0_g1_i1.p1 TRINITY_DN34762_c0_g1~~TRINITY_DN34762_c0_g1_i1.p1  ORF type:complete len:364 (-),score=13.55 TRINITY_DN34762_c0_g1_i1:150-1241(-)
MRFLRQLTACLVFVSAPNALRRQVSKSRANDTAGEMIELRNMTGKMIAMQKAISSFGTHERGQLVCLSGATLKSLGLVLQHYSLLTTSHICQPWWFLGLFLFFAGHVFRAVATAMASQMVLSFMWMWCIVTTPYFASLILGEQLQTVDVISSLGTIMGLLCLMYSSMLGWPRDVPTASSASIMFSQLALHEFIWICLAALGFIGASLSLVRKLGNSWEARYSAALAALLSGPLNAVSRCIVVAIANNVRGYDLEVLSDGISLHIILWWFLLGAVLGLLGMALQSDHTLQVQALMIYYAIGPASEALMAAIALNEAEGVTQLEPRHMLVFCIGVSLLLLCIPMMVPSFSKGVSAMALPTPIYFV